MTVLPHPKAPGIAVVPPCTQLWVRYVKEVHTKKADEQGNVREEGVQHTLSSEQREIGSKLLLDRSWSSDRPKLGHCMFSLLSFKFSLEDNIVDSVCSLLGNVCDGTTSSRSKHDRMLVEEGVLVYVSVDIATCDMISDLVIGRCEVPLCCSAQSIGIDTSRNVNGFGKLGNGFERSLNTILNVGKGKLRLDSLNAQTTYVNISHETLETCA